jgi:acetoacetyl-CoA synthetase
MLMQCRSAAFSCNGSGGTDVCGGIVTGVFTLPSYAGQIQAPVLGYNVEAFNEEGTSRL